MNFDEPWMIWNGKPSQFGSDSSFNEFEKGVGHGLGLGLGRRGASTEERERESNLGVRWMRAADPKDLRTGNLDQRSCAAS